MTIEHLDWRTFMKATDDTPPSVIKALDEYFRHFVALEIKPDHEGKPDIQTQKCVSCGEILTGLLGTWRWGLAHRVGECGKCGWPSHGHHFIKDESGESIATIRNFILQVHPDFVERRKHA